MVPRGMAIVPRPWCHGALCQKDRCSWYPDVHGAPVSLIIAKAAMAMTI